MTDREFGRYFEDFEPGLRIRHPLGRTVLEADNTWFTLLTMNTAQAHFDEVYARSQGHARMLVNSGLTLAIVLGLSVHDLTQNGVFNLGWNNIQLRKPVYVGDTLYARSVITSVRESKSRPEAGIVSADTEGMNERGETVISYERTFMVYRRGHQPPTGAPTEAP